MECFDLCGLLVCTSLLCSYKRSNFLHLHSQFLAVFISIVNSKDFAVSSVVISSQQASTENYNLRLPTAKGINFHNNWCSVKNGKVTMKSFTIKTVISAIYHSVQPVSDK